MKYLDRVRRATSLCLALWLANLSGCVALNGVLGDGEQASYAPTMPPEFVPPTPTSGTIYAAGHEVSLFTDLRANRVGDILTVTLVERTNASKSSSTSTSKTTEVDNANPTLLGRPVTSNGTPILENSISGDQSFDGEGDSSQSNRLDGNITVTVSRVLPNGNLLVRGEKWLTLNQGQEFVRISGIVRPYDISDDNTVVSTKVADARIEYAGEGVLADANSMGWLARFFNSPWMPF